MLRRELKINQKSFWIWTSILLILFLFVLAIYPSIIGGENRQAIQELMKMFPKELLQALNMDLVGIDSAFGWFQTEGFMFLSLVGTLYASITGATILLKEESDKTIEFLYSKPITRTQIVTAKVLCGFFYITAMTLLISIVCGIGFAISGSFDFSLFCQLMTSLYLVYLVCFFLLLWFSTYQKKTKKMWTIAIGFVFLSYILQMLATLSDKVSFLKYLSVFELASARDIITNGSLSWAVVGIAFLVMIIAISGTYLHYNRKELLA